MRKNDESLPTWSRITGTLWSHGGGAERLLPPLSTMCHYRTFEAANFVSAELHKGFSPMFSDADEIGKAAAKTGLSKAFDELNRMLAGQDYLTGNGFTFADAYAFNILTWAKPTGFDLNNWPNIDAFFGRVSQRDAVRASMKAEGLLKTNEAA